MRLFIACHLPDGLTEYLKSLSENLPHANLTIPKYYDLTLKFIGEHSVEQAEEIQRCLQTVESEPFQAELDAIGVFSEKMLRVVWVGVNPRNSFRDLHEKVDKALLPIVAPDSHFEPHITLARIKSVKDRQHFLSELKKMHVEPMKFTVDRIDLMTSELTSQGAKHRLYTSDQNNRFLP
jgi:RNA 2',3'-cyclic 3'-phosphodiesterase